jgi:outer membrane lipoprotein LolB
MAVDELGRPLRWQRQGWRVDYQYDDEDPRALPGRLFIEREGGLQLRLRIEEWRVPSPEE